MKVLITGGAGYIGSTIASCCEDNGITPIVLDDLSRGLRQFASRYQHYVGDIADQQLLEQVLSENEIATVVHCAAKIVVPESVADPLSYYDNNVGKAVKLLQVLERFGVRRFILSSTAAIYGASDDYFVSEATGADPRSPYAMSKWMLERILRDLGSAGRMSTVALRYFNPVGADPSLRSGLQDPQPTHALGKMLEAHDSGRAFSVTGTGWPTRDGSGLRDYVHVWDLARAHVKAIQRFDEVMDVAATPGYDVINLGTGTGTTVLELAEAFSSAAGTPLSLQYAAARPGDVAGSAAHIDKAKALLGWLPEFSLSDGLKHSIAWSQRLASVLEYEREESS